MSLTPSDHNIQCDFTGFVYKRSQCRKMWNGLIVRADLWEPRHPQDFIRVPVDDTRVVDARNEQRTQPAQDPPLTPDQMI